MEVQWVCLSSSLDHQWLHCVFLPFSYVPSCPVHLLSSTLPSPLPLLSNNLVPSFSPHLSPSSSPLTLHPNSPLTPLPPPSSLKVQSRLAVPQRGEGVDHASPRDRSQRQDPQLRERHLLLLRHGTVEEDTQGTAHWVRPLGGEASTPCHPGSAPLCRCGHAHSSNCVGVCGATPTSYIASYFEQLRCDCCNALCSGGPCGFAWIDCCLVVCSASSVADGVRVGRFDLNALVLLVYPRTQTRNKRALYTVWHYI